MKLDCLAHEDGTASPHPHSAATNTEELPPRTIAQYECMSSNTTPSGCDRHHSMVASLGNKLQHPDATNVSPYRSATAGSDGGRGGCPGGRAGSSDASSSGNGDANGEASAAGGSTEGDARGDASGEASGIGLLVGVGYAGNGEKVGAPEPESSSGSGEKSGDASGEGEGDAIGDASGDGEGDASGDGDGTLVHGHGRPSSTSVRPRSGRVPPCHK